MNRLLINDSPFTIVSNGIGKPIAHMMHDLLRAGVRFRALLIYANTVVLAAQVYDQRVQGRRNIVQPLLISFFYKCLAHIHMGSKMVPCTEDSRWQSFLTVQYMPEGPSIVILREAVSVFEGKKVLRVAGCTRENKERLANKLAPRLSLVFKEGEPEERIQSHSLCRLFLLLYF